MEVEDLEMIESDGDKVMERGRGMDVEGLREIDRVWLKRRIVCLFCVL